MKKIGVRAISLLVLTGTLGLLQAGDLEPPGPPAPTMKTLDEVEPRIPISSVPLTISASGSYYFTQDITATGTAIRVHADNVTIDLMGYTLTGPGSGTSVGVFIPDDHVNVEIRNGTIREFGYDAIYDNHSTGSSGHRVIGIRALDNGHGGIVLPAGGNHLIQDCTAVGNSFNGINVGYNSLVTDCLASGNGRWGIYTRNSTTVIDCTAIGNTRDGIHAEESVSVLNSTVSQNGQDGIETGAGAKLIGNTVGLNAEDGIDTTSALIADNLVQGNQGDGIVVDSSSTVKSNTMEGNVASNIRVSGLGNAIENNLVAGSAYGIYFVQPANFYADNRATNNSTADYQGAPVGAGDGGGNVSF